MSDKIDGDRAEYINWRGADDPFWLHMPRLRALLAEHGYAIVTESLFLDMHKLIERAVHQVIYVTDRREREELQRDAEALLTRFRDEFARRAAQKESGK